MVSKIIDYIVLEELSAHKLSKNVVKHIGFGWVPQGGLNAVKDGFVTYVYTQAMVKKEPSND